MLWDLGYRRYLGGLSGLEAGPIYLDSVVASTVFDVDATIVASYPGTGTTWYNLIAAPADSSAQADYNFTLGGISFVGSAGSAAAYLEIGTINSSNKTVVASGANSNFISNLHKTTGGADFWFAMTTRSAQNVSDTYMATLPALSSSNHGILLAVDTSERVTLWQRNGSANSSGLSGAVIQDNVDSVFIFSHSHSGNQSRLWYNSGTATEVAQTFGTTTTNPTGILTLFSETDGGSPLESGKRLYSVAMGNEYLDNTKAAAIIAHLEDRHARDYTP